MSDTIQRNVREFRKNYIESTHFQDMILNNNESSINKFYILMIFLFLCNIPFIIHLQKEKKLNNYKYYIVIVNFIIFGILFPFIYLSKISRSFQQIFSSYLFFIASIFTISILLFIAFKSFILDKSFSFGDFFMLSIIAIIITQYAFRDTFISILSWFKSTANGNDSIIVNILMIILYSFFYLLFCALFDFGIYLKNTIYKNASDTLSIFILIIFVVLFYVFFNYACPSIRNFFKYTHDRKVLLIDKFTYLDHKQKLGNYQQIIPGYFDKESYKNTKKTFFTLDTVNMELRKDYDSSDSQNYPFMNDLNQNIGKIDNANYSIAFWLYIDNQNTFIDNNNKIKEILNFNDKIKLYYDVNEQWIIFKSKDKQDKEHEIMVIKTYITQKWNHIVINVYGNYVDFYINNEFVLHNEMPNFYSHNGVVTTGENDGIYHGVIKQWYYFGKTLTSMDRYLLLKNYSYFV